jgi:hypothetical protein
MDSRMQWVIIFCLAALCIWLLKDSYTPRGRPGAKEGFYDQSLEQVLTDKVSPLANQINPLNNPLAPVGISSGEASVIRADVGAALNAPRAVPDGTGLYELRDPVQPIAPRIDDENSFLGKVAYCKRVGARGVEAFSDPQFAAECGFCMTGGTLKTGETFKEPTGIYIQPSEKQRALDTMSKTGAPFPRVLPSLGSAMCEGASRGDNARPSIALTAEQFTAMKGRSECKSARTVGEKGCGMCLPTSEYTYVGSNPDTEPLLFIFYGSGTIEFSVLGAKGGVLLPKGVGAAAGNTAPTVMLSTSTPLIYELGRVQEGTSFSITVSQGTTTDGPFIAGYFESKTPSGAPFRMPLDRLTLSDSETGSAPRRVSTFYSVQYGGRLTFLRPGTGKTVMRLSGAVPFTFVEPSELAGYDCPRGPFMTRVASAKEFSADPCIGQQAGGYSPECLRTVIEENGCSASGAAYKDPKAEAGGLSLDSFIRKIIQYANLSDKDREAAFKCTGKVETTPCDPFLDGKNKQVSKQCMIYMYNNMGEGGAIGRTYENVNLSYTSMNPSTGKLRFCTENGMANPEKPEGEAELRNVANGYAGKTGYAAIKQFLSDVFRDATDDNKDPTDMRGRGYNIMRCFNTLNKFPQAQLRGLTEPIINYTDMRTYDSAFVLGPIGMDPWRSAWGVQANALGDPSVKWIWNHPRAAADDSSRTPQRLLTYYNNTTGAPQQIRIRMYVDNQADIFLNGAKVGAITTYGDITVSFPPGESMLTVAAINWGGPAGICGIGSNLQTGLTVFKTDESWKMA